MMKGLTKRGRSRASSSFSELGFSAKGIEKKLPVARSSNRCESEKRVVTYSR